MNNIMIKRNWASDNATIKKAFKSIRNHALPTWLISYPEGTRRTLSNIKQAKGLPVFNQVLFPRTKGFVATVGGLIGSHIKAVYDFTLCYLHVPTMCIQSAPDMLRLHTHAFNGEYKFHLHVKRYEMDALPENDLELSLWLVDRFIEKDKFVDKMGEEWLKDTKLIGQ